MKKINLLDYNTCPIKFQIKNDLLSSSHVKSVIVVMTGHNMTRNTAAYCELCSDV